MSKIRRIAHLDMDAFFASVELLRYPQLKDLAVVIGGPKSALDVKRLDEYQDRLHEAPLSCFSRISSYTGRGVITTATYAARKFGVGSAMGVMKAAKLCPDAILLPVTFDEYRKASRAFKEAVLQMAPLIEDRGVDEIYLDLTELDGGQEAGGFVLAHQIQQAVYAATGLTCSIGVAPNKLLAKMASEFNKPRGISIVYAEEVPTKIWPLAVRKINGIGPKAEAKLHALQIFTIGELAAFDRFVLLEQFGKSYGAWLHRVAHGEDHAPLQTESDPVSMSRETTFERDMHAVHDKQELSQVFTRLCEQLALDLERKNLSGLTVGVKIKYHDFKTATRDKTLEQPIASASDLRQHAGQCLKRLDLNKRFRLLGVRISKLVDANSKPQKPMLPSAPDLFNR